MTDEHEEEDWSPDKERKETSPREIAKVYAEAVAKAFKEQKPFEHSGAIAGQYLDCLKPAPVTNLTLSIRQIKNGYVITSGSSAYQHSPPERLAEEYARTPAELLVAVHRLALAFLGETLDPVGPVSGAQGVGPEPKKGIGEAPGPGPLPSP